MKRGMAVAGLIVVTAIWGRWIRRQRYRAQ